MKLAYIIIFVIIFVICTVAGLPLLVHRPDKSVADYAIQDLGTLGGETSTATAINNHGDVVGQADTHTVGSHAFLWSHGTMKDLGGLTDPFTHLPNSSVETTASSINDHGDIVGDADTGYGSGDGNPRGIYHAVLWHNGNISDLGPLDGYQDSKALKINALGLVLGRGIAEINVTTTHTYEEHAFLYNGGKLWRLPNNFHALGMNAQGQIAGWRRRGKQTYIAVSDQGRIRDVAPVMPGYVVESVVLSNKGQIAMTLGSIFSGYNSEHYNSNDSEQFPQQALIWQKTGKKARWQSLAGLPSEPETEVNDINRLGQVVGKSRTIINSATSVQAEATAVLWESGTVVNLNQSIPKGLGWKLTEATGINDQGQIVGYGTINGHDHAFLLTPVHP